MNLLLKTDERALLSLSNAELLGLVNALNEVCNGLHIAESEFESRLGTPRQSLKALHAALLQQSEAAASAYEIVQVFPEPASVMVRAISVYGDPVELSTAEAQKLANDLVQAIDAAS